MVEASNITNPKITNLQKTLNPSSFYKFFTEALSQEPKKHNLILKIFSLSQQPSKSQTFKFLEFLCYTPHLNPQQNYITKPCKNQALKTTKP